jgi:hypothetical protein
MECTPATVFMDNMVLTARFCAHGVDLYIEDGGS